MKFWFLVVSSALIPAFDDQIPDAGDHCYEDKHQQDLDGKTDESEESYQLRYKSCDQSNKCKNACYKSAYFCPDRHIFNSKITKAFSLSNISYQTLR